ncbi:MAG: HlyD family efflux transporter periplasmic adaptor subunit [Gammaproteobacteria bacterium]|nr:HlyD family efflux transporter periplasmic adaptor subunit [Gammaproteobacteria bacterium]
MSIIPHITHEPPCQRRHFRLIAPIKVQLLGKVFRTKDWSIGGFRITGFDGKPDPNTKYKCHIQLSFGEFKIGFNAQALLIWYDEKNQELAAEFEELEPKQKELLQYFTSALIGGEMSSIDDTIRRLEIPVTKVSESLACNVDLGIATKKRPSKKTAMSAAYIVLGLLLTYYAIDTLYSSVFKVRVNLAAIVSPERTIVAPVSGTVEQLYVEQGDNVGPSAPIMYIHNYAVLERVELAKIKILESKLELKSYKEQLASQKNKLSSYKEIGATKLDISSARLNAIEKKWSIAERKRARFQALFDDGKVSEELFDQAASAVFSLRGELDVALAEQKIAQQAIRETDKGRFFTDHRLEGGLNEIRSALREAKSQVKLEEKRLEVMNARLRQLVVMSPLAGQVVNIYPQLYENVNKGDPVAVVERDGGREIEAYISTDNLQHVFIDQIAQVIITGRSNVISAKVTHIERNLLMETDPNIISGVNENAFRPVKIRLSFLNKDDQIVIERLPGGLPVVLEFDKQNLPSALKPLASLVNWLMPTTASAL